MYAVYVRDRVTGTEVGIGDMLSFSEASELVRVVSQFNGCDVFMITTHFVK